jgi:hypothetical protein
MMSHQERRIEGIKRVPVEALVEVCGLREDVPAFEAESRNVSDRGIRLRTAYMPELGAPVVCRFDNGGQEVLAEGVIAWASPQARGGEFGVRFTALNSRSAQVLGQMCRSEVPSEVGPGPKGTTEHDQGPAIPAGTRVKLHIEGLSSPMRARVQRGDSDQICVNSSLEFLKLGKRLHLEDVDAGNQSEAYIDGIDVVIDPDTGIPNLVVILRSQDVENTPEPSIIDTHGEPTLGRMSPSQLDESYSANPANTEEDALETVSDDVAAMRNKFEQSMYKVGLIVKITGSRAADLGKSLRDRGGPLVQRLVRSWSGGRRNKAESSPLRRRTAPPPSQILGTSGRNLRPQATTRSEPEIAIKPASRRKATIAAAGASVVLVTVITLASRGGAPTVATNSSNPQARAASSSQILPPPIAPQGAPATSAAPTGSALVAPVPLFGPTAMATLEPAPLIAPPGASTPNATAEREMAAAKAATANVAPGASEEPDDNADKSDGAASKPEDVAPWGKGKMRDPVIYRVKLDAPGTSIQGHSFSKGFSVVIPKRKAMESPKGYAKQDKRLDKVTAANGDDGVKLLWRFKDDVPVPGYRVRLRNNTVEFLISSKAE